MGIQYISTTVQLRFMEDFRTFVTDLREQLPWKLSCSETTGSVGRRVILKGEPVMVRLATDWLERNKAEVIVRNPPNAKVVDANPPFTPLYAP